VPAMNSRRLIVVSRIPEPVFFSMAQASFAARWMARTMRW
jgi:hypothetical protein